MKPWIPVAIAVFAANAFFFEWRTSLDADNPGPEAFQPVPAGLTAPTVTLLTGDGRERTLADWRGQTAIVTLWATWCEVCREEMPELDRIALELAEDNIAVLPVSLDRHPRALDLVRGYYDRHGLANLPVLHDRDAALSGKVTPTATPTTLIIDRNGKVIASATGRVRWMDPKVKALLADLGHARSSEDARALITR
ncbi:MAG: TlpA disulfide reductase family protein [Pseudomonadota bacterium]